LFLFSYGPKKTTTFIFKHKKLKILAAIEDKNLTELLIEAINDLLKKYESTPAKKKKS
jgi:hypothetical protein